MNRKLVLVLCLAALGGAGAAVPVSAALGAGGKNGTTVTVRIEGLKRTLLKSIVVKVPSSGSITKGGTPTGKCPATSAAGALDVATKHKWDGQYSSSLNDIFITKILGETESGTTTFWSVYVNKVAATTGVCEIKLHKGDQLLFAAIPATGVTYPLALKGSATAKEGHSIKLTVVGYDAKGKAKALAGATLKSGKLTLKTGSHGTVKLTAPKTPGKLTVTASKTGFVRAELTVRITP